MIEIYYIGTILAIIGAIINAKQSIKGFYIWIISNSILLFQSIITNEYNLTLLFIANLIINFYAIRNWSKK